MKNKIPTSIPPKIYNIYLLSGLLVFFLVRSVSAQTEMEIEKPDSISLLSTEKDYGFNMAGVYTGSSLGLNLNPSMYYRFSKNLIALGPNIQRDNFNVSGVQSYFQHDLAANFKKTIIYYHINMLYHVRANLSPVGLIQYRNIYGQEFNMKYSAFEHYMGFGLRKNLSDHLNFDTSIGAGAYYTMNAEQQPHQVPFRPSDDFSLLLKIGITYGLKQ